jgi:hypothetical protein
MLWNDSNKINLRITTSAHLFAVHENFVLTIPWLRGRTPQLPGLSINKLTLQQGTICGLQMTNDLLGFAHS